MDLFGTAGIRGHTEDLVTPTLALAVGRAAGRDGDEFVVARDGRTTSPALAAAVEAGLASAGVDVLRAGELPTPALGFASRGRQGVMLTASHNPPSDNGIKLFSDGREYDRAAERRIEERIDTDPTPVAWARWGTPETIDVLRGYRTAVVEYANRHGASASGVTVAVDCGNGMASLATPQVLWDLGAGVVTLNANVDGHFPGRGSKPTPESLREFRAFVADGEFDVGIAHDGDADRIVVVDPNGEIVHEDTILAVLAEHYTRRVDADDAVVVTTPNASARIDDRVRAADGRVERVRLGALHEGISAVREAGDDSTVVAFAAEPWKHVHPEFGDWIDGVVSAAVLVRLVAEAGDLKTLREPIVERPYRKTNVDCPDEHKDAVMRRLEEALPRQFSGGAVTTEHGVRIEFSDGSWVLVRPSGTEPYVRIYAESDDVDELVDTTVEVVETTVDRIE